MGTCAAPRPAHYCGDTLFSGWPRLGRTASHFKDVNLVHPNPKAASPPDALHKLRARAATAACLLAAALAARALEPSTPLDRYARQAWVMENGLPQNTIHALAQTRDGFLWLGTEVGLVRFDGSSFQTFDRTSSPALPDGDIRCLLAAPDGSLWIGTSNGLARWKNSVVTSFTTKDGLPGDTILALTEAADGAMWAYTDGGLARMTGDRFKVKSFWRPGSRITYDSKDGQTSAWLDPGLNAGNDWNRPAPVAGLPINSGDFFAQLSNGAFAAGSRANLLVLPQSPKSDRTLTPGKQLPGTRIQTVFADRQGALWIGTNGGLVRWFAGKLQRFPLTDPLATASILCMLEDREGDLWVGTETGGLHILRDQRFHTIGAHEGLSSDDTSTVVEDAAGRIWVGTSGGGLNVFTHAGGVIGPVLTYTVQNGLPSDIVLSLAAAPDGDVWVGTPDGLSRIHRGAITSYTSADGLPDDFIRSLMADPGGSLWIGTRRGLTHWLDAGRGTHMVTYTQANGLGSDLVGAMARDGHGDLWVATLAGLSRLKSRQFTTFTTADGLPSNVITALMTTDDDFLVIGTQDHGIAIWDTEKSRKPLGPIQGNQSIHAMEEDERRHLWLATANGLTRCDRGGSGIIRIIGAANCIGFGVVDGLRSRETATNSHPSAWRSRDGLLWFATPKGLVAVDPAHFPVNTVPPPVTIERLTVDDQFQPLSSGNPSLKIAAGHVHFEFDYAALSFVAPQKVRYRYMLEGFDHGWTRAGARRTAYYTNIPPGRYTFRVQAANNDGLWNTQGAVLTFELRPRFYQTIWFYLLLAAAAVALIVFLLRRRLRRARREFDAVLAERNRIAREIHDTLAQGYVGVSVQLEVLSELLRQHKVDAAQQHLDSTRSYVRQGLADARQSIWALRSQDSGETTLPVRLRRLVEAESFSGLECDFSIFGAYHPLPPGTEREILRIAQEAVHNVKKHAGAQHLVVQLEYGPAHLVLEVRDDGSGFEPATESRPGHYGLTGMRERAAAIGGTLEVTSEPEGGTSVRLRAPARREPREKTGEATSSKL